MEALIPRLRGAWSALRDDQTEPFELMALACSQCCQTSNSGNGQCPPPKETV